MYIVAINRPAENLGSAYESPPDFGTGIFLRSTEKSLHPDK